MSLQPQDDRNNPRSGRFPGTGFAPDLFAQDLFSLAGPVGREAANDRADVIRAQMMLEAAGYLTLPSGGPTGWPGDGLVRALGNYQRDNGHSVDGLLLPEGWNGDPRNGETLRSLRRSLGDTLAGRPVPTPAEVDARHERLADGAVPSDTPPETLRLQPGQQVAQAMPVSVPFVPPPVARRPEGRGPGNAEAPPHPPYISDADARIAAGVSRGLRNARDNLGDIAKGADSIRQIAPLLPRIVPELTRSLLTPDEPAAGMPPSQPAGDTGTALTGTPLPVPQRVDDKLQGRPAAPLPPMRTPPFLTPEMKDWIGTLPPRERPFAHDLLGIIVESNVHGVRGKPETVKANILAAQACQATLVEFPRLDGIAHVAGSNNAKTGEYQREEVIKVDKHSSSLRGSSRPDNTHAHPTNAFFKARLNTVDILRTGSDSIETETMTANERRRYDRLVSNLGEGVAGWARKMKPGESDDAYTRYVTVRCRDMWRRLEQKLEKDGVLEPSGAGGPGTGKPSTGGKP